ncbi:MAG: hypothetical protein UY81_C0012G0005 [Candidatus Giovannonibacteria bacterium GW2011_GWA2_53_7]|uniref:DNA 3'-5' helicase n=1 Tax=Candidatus Giovannonibacteria bacterium GW2011_GWA2_53_7 TaxID=1618650 RepID=A0A0G1Y0S1_9BACT|nr:MAG: hypothetical protein UY81_C0012G0005 [Candidatus Giovannonibacteria bacterium GW2011_GWA2_53_7]
MVPKTGEKTVDKKKKLTAPASDFSVQLNEQQKRAVEHGAGPLLVVAGAGTGKTTVIVERLSWLIKEKGLRPDELLCLTFTDKAAGEMADRIDRRLPYGYIDLWVMTFHSFGERMLREHAIDIGLPGDFTILNERRQNLFIRQHLDEFNLKYYRPLGQPTKFIRDLVKHFSRCKDEAITPEEYLAFVKNERLNRDQADFVHKTDETNSTAQELERLTELAEAYQTYNRLLLERGYLDFGDLINQTLRLFKTRPAVLERYREQFRYLLVDEFQDTNWAQYALLKLLAAPNNNLTVVGDDDQSIYKFRGASISNILEFKRDFPQSADVVLTENYRSKQNILDQAHAFIQLNNPNRLEVQLQNAQAAFNQTVSKQLQAARRGSGVIETLVADTEADEARQVLEKALEIKNAEPKTSWNDLAILVRANDHAEPFLAAAERAGAPYQFVASRGLYRKVVVLDLVAWLKLLDDYHEAAAMYRVLNLPVFSFTSDELIDLNHEARRRSLSLYKLLELHSTLAFLSRQAHQDGERLLGLIRRQTEQSRRNTVQKVCFEFLETSGYLTYLSRDDDPKKLEQLSYLNAFMREITDFERSVREPTVAAFLHNHELSLESGEEGDLEPNLENGPESLKIMTVHAAKGLEFKHVFITNLVERRFPSTERSESIPVPDALVRETVPEGDIHLQEERRLFYVALTRAKDRVCLTRALDYGGARLKKPSAFLYELKLVTERSVAEERKRQSNILDVKIRSVAAPEPEAILKRVSAESKYDYSRLNAYDRCPWQYRYAYVIGVPSRGKPEFSYGQTMHQTLHDFFHLIRQRTDRPQTSLFSQTTPAVQATKPSATKPSVKLAELLEIYERAWISEWFPSEVKLAEWKKRGQDSLEKFYESHAGQFPVPLYLEQPFTIRLNEYTIGGKIDRIDPISSNPEAGVEILDYKTGSGRTEPTKEQKFQLLLYGLAARDPNVLNLKVERLTFIYLDSNERFTIQPAEPDFAAAKTWALNQINQIRSGEFGATPGVVCRTCDYFSICPFRKLK